jgi:hypothetical protein
MNNVKNKKKFSSHSIMHAFKGARERTIDKEVKK